MKTKITTKLFACSFMALSALTACDNNAKNDPDTKIEVQDIDSKQGVEVESVILTHAPSKQNFTGIISPTKAVTVCPKVEGVVKKLITKQGSWVKKNSPLYQLDSQPYLDKINENKTILKELKASLSSVSNSDKQAKVDLEKHKLALKQAEKQAKRYKLLVKEGAVSEQAYQQAMNEVNTAQVLIENSKVESLKALSDMETIKARIQATEEQIKLDKQALNHTKINASMAGIVIYNPLQEGQAITSQIDTCIAIAQLNPIFINIPLTTDEFFALKEHYKNSKEQGKGTQKPSVQLILNDGEIYADSISFVFDETRITQDNKIVLQVLFNNKKTVLFPNMKVKAQIDMPNNEKKGVAVLPLEAIHYLNVAVKQVVKPMPTPTIEKQTETTKKPLETLNKETEKTTETVIEPPTLISSPTEQVEITENNKPFVYLVDSKTNSLKRQFINIKNIASNNKVIVNQGLKNGDKVVINSDGTLEEGVKVKINTMTNYLKKELETEDEKQD